jgi:hypothetical protein
LPVVGQPLLAPCLDRNIHAFDETLARLGHVQPVGVKLALLIAAPDANDQASFTDNVQRRQILGHAQGMIPGHDGAGHANLHPPGPGRNGGQEAMGSTNSAVFAEGVLGDPDCIEAQGLRELRPLEDVVIHFRIRPRHRIRVHPLAIGILLVHQWPLSDKETAKFHHFSLRARRDGCRYI